jgi:hypothetical protein
VRIGEVFNGVFDDDVGWRPATGAIKPVHVANGLFRAVQGWYVDTGPIVALVAWEKHHGRDRLEQLPDRTLEALLIKFPGVFEVYRGRHAAFERMRRYVRGILNADRAVFPAADRSSLTLSCGMMVSRDPMDKGVGDFAAALVGNPADEATLAALLLKALQANEPDDPVTAVVWPLLLNLEADPSVGQTGRQPVVPKRRAALERPHARWIVEQLQAAAATLAGHEQRERNRLRTLQRSTQFTVAALHAHAQAISADSEPTLRVPLLLTASGRDAETSRASELTLDALYRRFENWITARLADRIRTGRQLAPVEDSTAPLESEAAEKWLAHVGGAKGNGAEPSGETVRRRRAALREALQSTSSDVAGALARALMQSYLVEFESGGPQPFLQGLARRAGLFYPHFQGRSKQKRVAPSVPMVDMLVRACVRVGDELPFEDFLEQLWLRFGLVTGGRVSLQPSDFHLLREAHVEVDPCALATNCERFVDQLVAMGLARRYADNVTFVGDSYAG